MIAFGFLMRLGAKLNLYKVRNYYVKMNCCTVTNARPRVSKPPPPNLCVSVCARVSDPQGRGRSKKPLHK